MLRRHLQTFLARADQREGRGLPRFVRRELYAYLDCGILANGCARVHCASCGRDELVAFSCKGRGFCPSCCGRRMAETAMRNLLLGMLIFVFLNFGLLVVQTLRSQKTPKIVLDTLTTTSSFLIGAGTSSWMS